MANEISTHEIQRSVRWTMVVTLAWAACGALMCALPLQAPRYVVLLAPFGAIVGLLLGLALWWSGVITRWRHLAVITGGWLLAFSIRGLAIDLHAGRYAYWGLIALIYGLVGGLTTASQIQRARGSLLAHHIVSITLLWGLGTACGVIVGNLLPSSALGCSLVAGIPALIGTAAIYREVRSAERQRRS